MVQYGFGENRSRRIAGAKEEHVVGTGHGVSPLQQARPVQPGGHAQFAAFAGVVSGAWRSDSCIPVACAPAGFMARMKALVNLPSISGASVSGSSPARLRKPLASSVL